MDKYVQQVSTKVTKDGNAKVTTLTIDFTGAPLDLVQAYAMQAIKVKVQGGYRQNGVPSTDTFIVKDHPVGSRMPAKPTVDTVKGAYDSLSAEEKKALYQQLLQESLAREAADNAAE